MLAAILITVVFINPTLGLGSEQIIQRLNYGVMFQPKGQFKPISDYWTHTIQLVLPGYPDMNKYPRPCSTIKGVGTEVCQMLHSALEQSIDVQNSTKETFEKFIQQIYDTMPDIGKMNEDSRSKRSLLPFIGQISKSIFGTATEQDVNTMLHHISILDRNAAAMANALKKETSSLSSFMSVIDNRMSGAVAEIQQNHESIAQIGNKVWMLKYTLQTGILVSTHLTRQVHESSLLREGLLQLVQDIGQLVEGKIPQTLINPNTISTILKEVELKLQKQFPNFKISHSNPQHYYKHPLFVCARHGGSIYVTIKIPITAFHATFKVYQISSVPVPINNTSHHGIRLLDLPNYFAISEDNQYYTSMAAKQWSKCHGKSTKHCPREIRLIPILKHSCSSLIFQQIKNLIPQYCNFRFVPNGFKSGITQVTQDTVLVSNTSHLTMHCKDSWKTVPACKFCIMKIHSNQVSFDQPSYTTVLH